jgi:hypothetical protein
MQENSNLKISFKALCSAIKKTKIKNRSFIIQNSQKSDRKNFSKKNSRNGYFFNTSVSLYKKVKMYKKEDSMMLSILMHFF